MSIMMTTANNVDLWDTQEESCSHLEFQESELYINAEFRTQFRLYIPPMKERKNHKRW